MVEFNIDMQKLKAVPTRLKVVSGIVAFDLTVLLLGYLVLDDLMSERAAAVDRLRMELSQARQQNSELHKQVDTYPQLRHQFDEIMATGLTAAFDRANYAQFAQGKATQYHLTDLQFRVAGEAGDHPHSTKYRQAVDRAVFENGGILDTDAMSFWAALLDQARGHYRIVEASLDRMQDVSPLLLSGIKQGGNPSDLKAKIELQWVGIQSYEQETK